MLRKAARQQYDYSGILKVLSPLLDQVAAFHSGHAAPCTAASWLQTVRTAQTLARDISRLEKGLRQFSTSAGVSNWSQIVVKDREPAAQQDHGLPVSFDTSTFAPLSHGSCLLSCGELQMLARVDIGPPPKRGSRTPIISDPLMITYQERSSAWWKFPMQNHMRKHTASEEQGGTLDLIQAAILPQIPPGFNRTLQVTAALHSADSSVDAAAMGINAVSAALMSSGVPWYGPVGAVRMAMVDSEILVSPSAEQAAAAEWTMLFVGGKHGVVLIDMQGGPARVEALLLATRRASEEVSSLVAQQLQLTPESTALGPVHLAGADVAARQRIFGMARADVNALLSNPSLQPWELHQKLDEAKNELQQRLNTAGFFKFDNVRAAGSGAVAPKDLSAAWKDLLSSCIQDLVLRQNFRVGGRGLVDHRGQAHRIGLLSTPHGSALSHNGATQVLSTVTVGNSRGDSKGEGGSSAVPGSRRQLAAFVAESLKSNSVTGFKHRGLTRAERASETLAEKALSRLLPTEKDFPFAIRIDMDVLSDDGAAVETALNSAALALQNAKVPLSAPVAGASVALISSTERASTDGVLNDYTEASDHGSPRPEMQWELLTDPQELEEMASDLSLNVAGTEEGLVAFHLTSSVSSLPLPAVEAALVRARAAQLQSLASMQTCVSKAQHDGPKYGRFKVAKEQIPALIGLGGENLKALESETGSRLVMRGAEGALFFVSPTAEKFAQAEAMMSRLVGQDMKEGDVYVAKVVKIVDYGAYVALPSGPQALLHISELSHSKVGRVQDVLEVGQPVEVKYLGRDKRNFHKISHKACLPPPAASSGIQTEESPQGRARQQSGRAETQGTYDTLKIGQVYPGRVGQPRGPLRDQSDSVALVRGKDGVMRQLIISDASKQQARPQNGQDVQLVYLGKGRCQIEH